MIGGSDIIHKLPRDAQDTSTIEVFVSLLFSSGRSCRLASCTKDMGFSSRERGEYMQVQVSQPDCDIKEEGGGQVW